MNEEVKKLTVRNVKPYVILCISSAKKSLNDVSRRINQISDLDANNLKFKAWISDFQIGDLDKDV